MLSYCVVFWDVAAENSTRCQVSTWLLKEISKHLRRAHSKWCEKIYFLFFIFGEVVNVFQKALTTAEIFLLFFLLLYYYYFFPLCYLKKTLCMLLHCSFEKLSCNLKVYMLVLFHFNLFNYRSSIMNQSCWFSWFKNLLASI